MPGIVIVKAGTLDDPSGLRPALEAYCDSALPWVPGLAETRFARSNF
jgi:hypothetical protein